MGELWDKIAESYKMIARLLDPKSDICACATDMENNDVILYLQFLAFKLRYPGITSGNSTITEQYLSQLNGREKRSIDKPYDYDYDFCWNEKNAEKYDRLKITPEFRKVDFSLSDVKILKEIAEVMVDGDEGTAAVFLDSADHWDWWRNMVKRLSMSDEGYYDIAVFMFCKLN